MELTCTLGLFLGTMFVVNFKASHIDYSRKLDFMNDFTFLILS